MRSIKLILVPTDYSACAQAALLHAFHLAQQYHAGLHVLHVQEVRAAPPPGLTALEPPLLPPDAGPDQEETESWNNVAIRRVTISADDVPQAILRYAREQGVDVVIMGAHGDSGANRFLLCGLDNLLLGQTAEQVVRLAECPVLTVGLRRGRYPSQVRHILVPVDPASVDQAALESAKEMAGIYGADVALLLMGDPARESAPTDAADERQEVAEGYVRRLFEAVRGEPVAATVYAVPGRPGRDLASFAEQHDIQMIVLGPQTATTMPAGAVSSEADPIAQVASFSVLTARPGIPVGGAA